MNEEFKIIDESGDKKYFAIIPYYILNHSSYTDQALYLNLKRKSGEDGICFASEKTLCKEMKIGKIKLKKSFKYLLDKNWIKNIGKVEVNTTGGVQLVNAYKINDIWKENVSFYQGVSKSSPLSKGCPNQLKGVSKSAQRGVDLNYKEETIKEETIKEDILLATQGVAGKEINDLIELFNKVNPSYKRLFANKSQRQALERLVKQHGLGKIEWAIKVLEKTNVMPFSPNIITPIELENKLGSLISFIQKEKSKFNQTKTISI